MIFLDSTVLIDYFNGVENWQVNKLDSILGKEVISIGDLLLLKYYKVSKMIMIIKRPKQY